MKANSILAVVLVLVMLASVFAWLSAGTGKPSEPDIVDPVSNDPTATATLAANEPINYNSNSETNHDPRLEPNSNYNTP